MKYRVIMKAATFQQFFGLFKLKSKPFRGMGIRTDCDNLAAQAVVTL